MPPLDEGTLLDMPTSVPRVSITQAADDLKHRDGLLRGFPEVESVIGKAGRADTPTDPAPLVLMMLWLIVACCAPMSAPSWADAPA